MYSDEYEEIRRVLAVYADAEVEYDDYYFYLVDGDRKYNIGSADSDVTELIETLSKCHIIMAKDRKRERLAQ